MTTPQVSNIKQVQDKIKALEEQIAIEEASSSPLCKELNNGISDANSTISSTRQGFYSGPQSYDSRLYSYEIKADALKKEKVYFSALKEWASNKRIAYQKILSHACILIKNGQADDFVSSFIDKEILEFEELHPYSKITSLEKEWEVAKEIVSMFTKTKRIPK
jgi:hypothetical protein